MVLLVFDGGEGGVGGGGGNELCFLLRHSRFLSLYPSFFLFLFPLITYLGRKLVSISSRSCISYFNDICTVFVENVMNTSSVVGICACK